MEQIRFRDVVRTIAVVFLLVNIAEQATAVSIDDADCYGLCTPHCDQTCKGLGYTGWFCPSFRGKSGCCCTPKKK
ncbi:BnaC03g60760D [Brassica napus]|uniref:(rape) hypothetical protein n=1 Tax=Brassica napus TaxID=3708 RepID=A0A078HPG3_BRANA|nr:unnamed protein product [Brassica napus]CDY39466.1 BnaC03g60760D [Brassica napus]